MKDIINSIDVDYDTTINRNEYSGILITTSSQRIELLIDDEAQCCENFGYLHTEDSLEDFINAEIIDIILTDEGYLTEGILEEIRDYEYHDYSFIFCTVKTTKGDLQFTAYNQHNGYYGHKVIIKSNQLNHNDVI